MRKSQQKKPEQTPLFIAIGVGLLCLSILQPTFYHIASQAWHYYLMMYVAEMLIVGAIIKCCQSERLFNYAIVVYLLSMISYFVGLMITLAYTKGYVDKVSAGMAIDSITNASEVFFIVLITIACFDINSKFKIIK